MIADNHGLTTKTIRGVITQYSKNEELLRKSCSRCKKIKDIGSFKKSKDTKYGLSSSCIKCSERVKEPDFYELLYAECWGNHGEDYLPCLECLTFRHKRDFHRSGKKGSKRRDYRKGKCKECASLYNSEYRKKNKKELSIKRRKSYEKNKEKHLIYMKAYAEKNKEKIAEYQKWYDKEFKEDIRKQRRSYRVNNPKKRKYQNTPQSRETDKLKSRRVRLYDSVFSFNKEEVLEYFNNMCFLTGSKDNLHIDHFIPRSVNHGAEGMNNVTLISGGINQSKGENNPFDWIKFPWANDYVSEEEWDKWVYHLATLNGLTPEEFEEYVYWCFDNPRSIEDLKKDNTPSLELWKKSKEKVKNT